ncbi:hydrolase [Novosphingobium marinum]|uniref:Pimeloyl-ACP methyl ester carboxylesterase n=1 Tax=Novosphingobium marinum TaxID=1514948 RepID=A0A7Y9XWW4_9SPHN|nr:alpha/beta hydrolase [Novosphingobium marinum]NYH96101.1 pimeloyl-ACP methyl ester carboxylesterase [Novosphingobium marinum]GGC32492.1 hydrolase [Novosphingobium marinum]
MTDFVGPTSHSFVSQRTRLHYLDWGNHEAPPLILVHGGQDHARTWDWTAEAMRRDYHVIAPDLRGHGDSEWSSDGSYGILSWVFDLAQLIDDLGLAPVNIVAHSLGGAISLRYTGLFPDKVRKLVSIEGSGAVPRKIHEYMSAPVEERLTRWIAERRRLAKPSYRYPDVPSAIARMREANPTLTAEQVRHLALHAVRRNEDGTFSWKYDRYTRNLASFALSDADSIRLWQQIECPVLLCWGNKSWVDDPNSDGTARHFRDVRTAEFDAGHWLHHDCFDDFVALVRRFLAEG